jgi:hypothetical protein
VLCPWAGNVPSVEVELTHLATSTNPDVSALGLDRRLLGPTNIKGRMKFEPTALTPGGGGLFCGRGR